MAINLPDLDSASDTIAGFTLVGSGVDAAWKALDNYDDTKYITLPDTPSVERVACRLTGTLDDGVSGFTPFFNIRLKKTGSPTGILQLTAFSSTNGKYIRPANLDVSTLTTSFVDYSLTSAADWIVFGGSEHKPGCWGTTVLGGSGSVEISHYSVGDQENKTYTITASATAGGTIDPVGAVTVDENGNQEFTFDADSGYFLEDVLVDGVSVGTFPSYLFTSVTADHTIEAQFAVSAYDITASAGAGGSISPSGTVPVDAGEDQTFTITPDALYAIDDVLVDSVSVGAVASYEFLNVSTTHTIAASFTLDGNEITSSAGAGGSITPEGATFVLTGEDQLYVFTPDEKYRVADVLVDGVSVGPVTSYLFENVTAAHTIAVTFVVSITGHTVYGFLSGTNDLKMLSMGAESFSTREKPVDKPEDRRRFGRRPSGPQ